MRVAMDHEIAAFTSKPNTKQAIFVPLASAHIETITKHLNATSPVIFIVDSESRETSELESLLTGTPHKAPIYFSYNTAMEWFDPEKGGRTTSRLQEFVMAQA
jgi:hypothetical protein